MPSAGPSGSPPPLRNPCASTPFTSTCPPTSQDIRNQILDQWELVRRDAEQHLREWAAPLTENLEVTRNPDAPPWKR